MLSVSLPDGCTLHVEIIYNFFFFHITGQYLHKAPVILDKPDIVYVVENQPVTITITLNHVQATGTWKRFVSNVKQTFQLQYKLWILRKPLFTRRGVVLLNKPDALEMTMPDDDQHALHIAKVKSTDVGQLIFMANNQYGSDLCTLQLAMAGELPFSGQSFLLNS